MSGRRFIHNTIVRAYLYRGTGDSDGDSLLLQIGSVTVDPKQVHQRSPADANRRARKYWDFQGQRGIGEFGIETIGEYAVRFSEANQELIGGKFLPAVCMGQFTFLKYARRDATVREGDDNIEQFQTLSVDIRWPPAGSGICAVGVVFDYRGHEFLEAAYQTLAEFAELTGTNKRNIAPLPTAQYTWATTSPHGGVLHDVASELADKYGIPFDGRRMARGDGVRGYQYTLAQSSAWLNDKLRKSQ